jgi:hypothetical protein
MPTPVNGMPLSGSLRRGMYHLVAAIELMAHFWVQAPHIERSGGNLGAVEYLRPVAPPESCIAASLVSLPGEAWPILINVFENGSN